MAGCSTESISAGETDNNVTSSEATYNKIVNMSVYLLVAIIGLIMLLFLFLKYKEIFVKNRSITVAIAITFIPFMVLILMFFYILGIFLGSEEGLCVQLMNIELTIIFVYLIGKCMKGPYSKLSDSEGVSCTAVSMDKAMNMFYLCFYIIFVMILTVIAIVIAAYAIIDYNDIDVAGYVSDTFDIYTGSNILSIMIYSVMFLILLAAPLLGPQGLVVAAACIVVWIFFSVLPVLLYVMIINATVRMKLATKTRYFSDAYIVIMFIPVLNVINCFLLIHAARKALRNEGIELGAFGAKRIKSAVYSTEISDSLQSGEVEVS